jgi:hypothetical protein
MLATILAQGAATLFHAWIRRGDVFHSMQP